MKRLLLIRPEDFDDLAREAEVEDKLGRKAYSKGYENPACANYAASRDHITRTLDQACRVLS